VHDCHLKRDEGRNIWIAAPDDVVVDGADHASELTQISRVRESGREQGRESQGEKERPHGEPNVEDRCTSKEEAPEKGKEWKEWKEESQLSGGQGGQGGQAQVVASECERAQVSVGENHPL